MKESYGEGVASHTGLNFLCSLKFPRKHHCRTRKLSRNVFCKVFAPHASMKIELQSHEIRRLHVGKSTLSSKWGCIAEEPCAGNLHTGFCEGH